MRSPALIHPHLSKLFNLNPESLMILKLVRGTLSALALCLLNSASHAAAPGTIPVWRPPG